MWMAKEIFETIERDRNYLQPWLPFVELTTKLADTENFIQSILNQPQIKKDEIYSIWFKNEFAGLIGFKDTDWLNRKTELGYWLAEKMQGKGIATKCVEKLIRYTFQKLKLNRIQIKTAVGNLNSAAIPKRLGFKFEGIERDGEKHNQTFVDLEIYSILKTDYKTAL
ncbi:MAG: GNAT family N-acetyltransferase [Draconibacterium sp.]|nr:GNAT family N-acetyltransferase [Draconibacterium sp.]